MMKEFPTEGVLGVYTGFVLKHRGFSEIHDVMDHLYPGIMTLGCAHMADSAKQEVLKQHPEFSDLPTCDGSNWESWITEALVKFGPTISVDSLAAAA